MNNVYILLLGGRPDGEARATSILLACKERATKPAGLPAAARRGAAAGGHLLRCRSSTMKKHRLRRGAAHLPPGARAKVQTLFIDRPLEKRQRSQILRKTSWVDKPNSLESQSPGRLDVRLLVVY